MNTLPQTRVHHHEHPPSNQSASPEPAPEQVEGQGVGGSPSADVTSPKIYALTVVQWVLCCMEDGCGAEGICWLIPPLEIHQDSRRRSVTLRQTVSGGLNQQRLAGFGKRPHTIAYAGRLDALGRVLSLQDKTQLLRLEDTSSTQ
ncbi:hypothetical protein BaRGS_00019175 [Batillaria attramentaria]|uniref:Uncharacterized protein n=1 Tax=Batillaria attramentaria TaxID=370345 RepID=A0ABD0KR25_9CAEN